MMVEAISWTVSAQEIKSASASSEANSMQSKAVVQYTACRSRKEKLLVSSYLRCLSIATVDRQRIEEQVATIWPTITTVVRFTLQQSGGSQCPA